MALTRLLSLVYALRKIQPEVCRLCRGSGRVNCETGQHKGRQEICQRCGGSGQRTLRTK